MSDKTPGPGGSKTQADPTSGPPAPPGNTGKKAPAKKSAAKKTSPSAKKASAAQSSKVSVTEAGAGESSPKPNPRTVSTKVRDVEETKTIPAQERVEEPVAEESPAKKRGRRAHLRLTSVDPWSVGKVTAALSVALGVVITVAVSILWVVLGVSGIWDSINDTVSLVLANDAETFDIGDYVGYGRVIGLTMLVSVINVILITAISVIGAYLYNLAAHLMGGMQVTLSDDN